MWSGRWNVSNVVWCVMWPIYGVEYLECDVMWNVTWCKMGCSARCGVMHNVADMVQFEIWYYKVGWCAATGADVIWNVRYGENWWWCDVECGVAWNNVRVGVWCGMMQCAAFQPSFHITPCLIWRQTILHHLVFHNHISQILHHHTIFPMYHTIIPHHITTFHTSSDIAQPHI